MPHAPLRSRRNISGLSLLLFVTLLCFAGGCVNMYPTRSGYLSDYTGLRPINRRDRVRVLPVDYAALAEVDSFYIEPVDWLADDMGQPAHNAKQTEKIRDSLYEALVEKLGCIRPIVDQVGPNTARVRSAVTGVQEAKPFINLLVVTQVGPLFNGGAVAEIEVLGPNGEQIAAQSGAYTGRDWDIVGFFRRSTHARDGVRRAAKRLAKDLSQEWEPEE